MSVLRTKCPMCRNVVDTGIDADEETLQELGPELQLQVLCGDCRQYQKILVKDLYIGSEQIRGFPLAN